MGSLVEPFRGPVLEIGKADESETELAQMLVEIGKIGRPIIERKKVRLGDEADRPLLEGTSAAANDLQFRTLGVELDEIDAPDPGNARDQRLDVVAGEVV